jgi:hypothetical protein
MGRDLAQGRVKLALILTDFEGAGRFTEFVDLLSALLPQSSKKPEMIS